MIVKFNLIFIQPTSLIRYHIKRILAPYSYYVNRICHKAFLTPPGAKRETALLVRWTNAQRRPRRTLGPPRPRTVFLKYRLSPTGLFLHKKEASIGCPFLRKTKARDGTRTRGLDLGKVALHQLSHSRISFVASLSDK